MRRLSMGTIRSLIRRATDHQLKFVVDSPADYPELLRLVEGLRANPTDVWIMPQGVSEESLDSAREWLGPWCDRQGFQYCDRQQIRWYGNRRGT